MRTKLKALDRQSRRVSRGRRPPESPIRPMALKSVSVDSTKRRGEREALEGSISFLVDAPSCSGLLRYGTVDKGISRCQSYSDPQALLGVCGEHWQFDRQTHGRRNSGDLNAPRLQDERSWRKAFAKRVSADYFNAISMANSVLRMGMCEMKRCQIFATTLSSKNFPTISHAS